MGFLKFSYVILLNFIFTLFIFAADPNHNTQAPTVREKINKDETQNFSPADKVRISEIQTNIVLGKLVKVPATDRNKETARVEDPTQVRSSTSNGNVVSGIIAGRPAQVQAEEITAVTPNQLIQTYNAIKESGGLPAFYTNAAKTQFDSVVNKLDAKGEMKVNENTTIPTTTNKVAVLELQEGPAKIAYMLAVESLRQAAAAQKFDPTAAAQESAALSKANLSKGLNSGLSDFTSHPLALADYSNIATSYLDLAAKQISNSTSDPVSALYNDNNLSSPFSGDTELNKLFNNALNTTNSSDSGSQKLPDRLSPFEKLINSKEFLENGAGLLGNQNANTLVAAVQAAELLKSVGSNLNAAALEFLGNAFNLGTGIGAPPCVSCVEGKNSSLVTQAENYKASEENVSKSTQDWIDEANLLADTANRNKSLDPKEVAYMLKGRTELDKLLGELKAYKSLGVLDLVQIPSTKSMSRNYKEATEIAAGILFIVRQKKIKEGEAPLAIANIKKIKNSASNLLEKLKKAQRPSGVELTLRGFFENNENNEIRTLWRRYEDANYKKLRSATAQIIMSRYMSMIKLPSFEKVTLERASLAYLTGRAFKVINEREAKLLKEKQLRLGLQPLQEIRMKGDKEKPKVEEEKIRYPSFIDEEN